MSTQAGLVTVAEFLRLPDPKEGHYELRHGEVVLVPPAKWNHQDIQDRIQMLLKRLGEDEGIARMEMPFRPGSEHEFWIADVGFVSFDRASAARHEGYLEGAPEIVAEVLSPSNTAAEMNDRMKVCLASGCRSFWVADPDNQLLSVTEGDLTRHYGIDASFHCDVFGATVSVREIFE
jgi:Uma2 family endonuclease